MKALILAAGEGTRLRPMTLNTPKCLIPIAGKTILDRQSDALRSAGVSDIRIVIGHLKDCVQRHVSNMSDVRLIENPEYATSNILKSFWYGLAESNPGEGLIVIAGDVVFESAIMQSLVETETDGIVICMDQKECAQEEVKVRLDDNNQVMQFGKKMNPKEASGEFLGVMKISESSLSMVSDRVNEMISNGGENGYLFDMLNDMITRHSVEIKPMIIRDQLWEEIDFYEDIKRVSSKLEIHTEDFK